MKRTIKYDFGVTSHYLDMPPPRRYVYMRELLELQARLKQAAVASNLALPSELRGLQVELQFTDGNLVAVCEESNGARAFFVQLFFEQLQGTTFGWCSRRDCGKIFRRTSKHAKKYCTDDCAHLVAVRNSRNREG